LQIGLIAVREAERADARPPTAASRDVLLRIPERAVIDRIDLHRAVVAVALAARLRASDPPVIARVEEGKVLLDLRTVFPEQDKVLTQVLVNAAEV